MPANVRAGQVMGLVDLATLADEFGADLVTLLPIVDAAEMLGLIKVDKGKVKLTEFGQKFQKVTKSKVKLVKDQLSKIEPFRTALKLAGESKKGVTTQEICEDLLWRDTRWHHTPEVNEALVQLLLIHWAIYAGLLSFNGKTGRFIKV
jgi:NitT/TauT family transport system ATP-binding protein